MRMKTTRRDRRNWCRALNAPVYMTRFAADLLATRRTEPSPGAPNCRSRGAAGRQGGSGPFEGAVHSGFAFDPNRTASPFVRNTARRAYGCWKLDDAPFIGNVTQCPRFQGLGDEGVIAAISDSTNVHARWRQPQRNAMSRSAHRDHHGGGAPCAITTFASNVARISAVAQAAQAAGRSRAGRARDERVVSVARELAISTHTGFRSAGWPSSTCPATRWWRCSRDRRVNRVRRWRGSPMTITAISSFPPVTSSSSRRADPRQREIRPAHRQRAGDKGVRIVPTRTG